MGHSAPGIYARAYLEGRPDLRDLEDVWLPWSWSLVHPGQEALKIKLMTEESVRTQCLQLEQRQVLPGQAKPIHFIGQLTDNSRRRLGFFRHVRRGGGEFIGYLGADGQHALQAFPLCQ